MKKILIVEDTLVGLRMLRLLLEQTGLGDADVTEATDGQKAWDLMRGGTFDLVLSDVYVPGLTGKEIVERARAENLSAPIVVITADRSEELSQQLLSAGAAAVLHKPCKAADFESALAALPT